MMSASDRQFVHAVVGWPGMCVRVCVCEYVCVDDGLPIPNDMLADALKEERVVAVPGNLSWADIPAVKV